MIIETKWYFHHMTALNNHNSKTIHGYGDISAILHVLPIIIIGSKLDVRTMNNILVIFFSPSASLPALHWSAVPWFPGLRCGWYQGGIRHYLVLFLVPLFKLCPSPFSLHVSDAQPATAHLCLTPLLLWPGGQSRKRGTPVLAEGRCASVCHDL